jgi:hypothetical protein
MPCSWLAEVQRGGSRSPRPQPRRLSRPTASATSSPARCLLRGSGRPKLVAPGAAATRTVVIIASLLICTAPPLTLCCAFYCTSASIVSAPSCAVQPFPHGLLLLLAILLGCLLHPSPATMYVLLPICVHAGEQESVVSRVCAQRPQVVITTGAHEQRWPRRTACIFRLLLCEVTAASAYGCRGSGRHATLSRVSRRNSNRQDWREQRRVAA